MPRLGPIKRRDLIACLRQLGFSGPYSGGKHRFMVRGTLRLRLPNPHQRDIGLHLLKQILYRADIATTDWEAL